MRAKYTKQMLCLSMVLDEEPVDPKESVLLVFAEARIAVNRLLHASRIVALRAGVVVEEAGLVVHSLGRDLQRAGNALEHLGGRLIETALNLAQVWIRDFRHLRQLP